MLCSVLVFLIIIGLFLGLFFFIDGKESEDDNFILSTSEFDSGFFKCSSVDYEPSFNLHPKKISLGKVVPTNYTDDNSKDSFASPKYINFVEKKYFENKNKKEVLNNEKTEDEDDEYYDEESLDIMSISFDYGNGFLLFDDTNKTDFEYSYCYNRYSYDDKTKNITLYRTNLDDDCRKTPSSYKIKLVNFYEKEDVAYLTLTINHKNYEFASDIYNIKDTNIDLSGEYHSAYICEEKRNLNVIEIISLNDNNSGEFILMVDSKIKKKIPIKYITIDRDGENLVIVYSVKSGIYLELDIEEDSLSNISYGDYYKIK